MSERMSKEAYLADLQARNRHNRQIVENVFVPLDEARRSWQPAPGEWSVDQCLQHLIIAFDWLSPNYIPALDRPKPAHDDGTFRHSWLARRFMDRQFDPQYRYQTRPANNPKAAYRPDTLTRWMDQQARLEAHITRAAGADLQTKCRVVNWLPMHYNLGDYLRFFVAHDELHIDQAQRALAAYAQQVPALVS